MAEILHGFQLVEMTKHPYVSLKIFIIFLSCIGQFNIVSVNSLHYHTKNILHRHYIRTSGQLNECCGFITFKQLFCVFYRNHLCVFLLKNVIKTDNLFPYFNKWRSDNWIYVCLFRLRFRKIILGSFPKEKWIEPLESHNIFNGCKIRPFSFEGVASMKEYHPNHRN